MQQNARTKHDESTDEVILTTAGLKRLEDELEDLKTVQLQVVAERIKTALGFGDISENAEYDEAKNEQAFIQGKISRLESTLSKARVVDEEDINTDFISVGNTVTLLDEDDNEELTYTIVGSAEADPMTGKISNESPVGRALLGATMGQSVSVSTPGGVVRLKVLSINL